MSQRDEIKQLLKRRIGAVRKTLYERPVIKTAVDKALLSNPIIKKANALSEAYELADKAYDNANVARAKASKASSDFVDTECKKLKVDTSNYGNHGTYEYTPNSKKLATAIARKVQYDIVATYPEMKAELDRINRLEGSLGDMLILATSDKQLRAVVERISSDLGITYEFEDLVPDPE